jgi:hypothetical protein
VLGAHRRGTYRASWEAPLSAVTGRYRLVVSATRYRLVSRPFRVAPSRALRVVARRLPAHRRALELRYPAPVPERDLTARPVHARGGVIRVLVDGRGRTLRIPPSGHVTVKLPAAGALKVPWARDPYGNVTGSVRRP